MNIALIGSSGLVGSAIADLLRTKPDICLTCISRDDVKNRHYAGTYDLVINSNGSGNKTWSNNNPSESFRINCSSVYEYHSLYRAQKYVLVSSIDAASPLDYSEDAPVDPSTLHTYGMHKNFAESIVKQLYDEYLILRLGGLLSPLLRKNVAYDLKNKRPLFISEKSLVNFISTSEVANIVFDLMTSVSRTTINVGAHTSVTVQEIIDFCGLHEQYLAQDTSDLSKLMYMIPTDRLQRHVSVKSTKEYLLEYMHY